MSFQLKSLFIIAIVNMGLFTSCSNDFQLTEGEVNIPIIYGFLTPEDEFTYIRVEKAFIDEKTSARELALDPNNLYYDNITVTISNATNPNKLPTPVKLTRIDGNLEGLVREDGAFSQSPNILYRTETSALNLSPGDEYKITILDENDNILTEGSTICLTKYTPNSLTTPSIVGDLSFTNVGNTNFGWLTDKNAVLHNIQIFFYIDEVIGTESKSKELVWNLGSNIESSDNRARFAIKGTEFFNFMANSLEKNASIKRFFDRSTIRITSGGKEINEFLTVANANLGITSSGEIPKFTNFSNGALGVFSSRTRFVREDIKLARLTLDSLKNGVLTKDLNFQ